MSVINIDLLSEIKCFYANQKQYFDVADDQKNYLNKGHDEICANTWIEICLYNKKC